jgi:hypothetical protein
MRTATLHIVQTAPDCLSYRALDRTGAIVWSNRVFNCHEGDAGARRRLGAFAERFGYRIIEPRQKRRA